MKEKHDMCGSDPLVESYTYQLKKTSIEELTNFLQSLNRLEEEGHDMGVLIDSTWKAIDDLIVSNWKSQLDRFNMNP